MKKTILFAMLCFLFMAGQAQAHPPSKVKLDYNKDSKELKITIDHKVANPEKHYIEKVVVRKNKKDIAEKYFEAQDEKSDQVVVIPDVDAETGDVLWAKATCNIFGSKRGKLEVM